MITISTRDAAAATPAQPTQQITGAIKFPTFELIKYSTFGDDVNKYIETVEHEFTENKVISFLNDETYADNHKDTSKAYCFTIFKSLIGSIHEYLILELSEKLHNTATLWTTLSTTLTTTISEMTAVNTAWSKIHKLKCNYPEDFEMFFNDYVNAELHLFKFKSTAIEDQCFLRSLLFHKIDMDDMKSDIALLLLEDKTETARSILNTLKKKAKALSLNNKTGYSARRGTVIAEKEAKRQKFKNTSSFPKNHGNKLPLTVYKQVKEWFDILSVAEEKRSPEQVLTLSKFVFNYPSPSQRDNHSTSNQKQKTISFARKATIEKKQEQQHQQQQTVTHPDHNYNRDYYNDPYNPNDYYNQNAPYYNQNNNGNPSDSYARRAAQGRGDGYQNQRFHPPPYAGRGRSQGVYPNQR